MKRLMRAIGMGVVLSMAFADASVAQVEKKPNCIVIAPKATYEVAKENILKFLETHNVPLIHAAASDEKAYKNEKYILVLGGPNESEGVGDMVKQLLSKEEQERVSQIGNEKMFLKDGKWREDQYVMIFAGPDRNSIRSAITKNREQWREYVGSWFDIRLSITDTIGY